MKVSRTLLLRSLGLILAIGAFTLGINAQRRHSRGRRHPDKVIATRTIQGKLTGFESGDYLHAVIEKTDGKKDSFYIRPPGMEYFLVLHKGEPLEATYQIVNAYIPEAGGRERVEQLIAAKAGNLTYAAWWKTTKRRLTLDQLDKKYGSLIEKATIRPFQP